MNHSAICARLPHAGRMCLLERLESWDGDSITCIATSHRDTDNPLRSSGRLHAVAGVEYAAQVVALHGNLLSATDTPTAMDGGSAGREAVSEGSLIHWTNAGAVFRPPAIGYLASVRDLKLDLEDLGTVPEDLRVTARRLSGDASGFIYEFEIRAGARAVLSGRLAAKLLAAGDAA
jgi:predicted hotdog family 3-hydroxylacyl-ACP dehydratase